MKADLLPAIDDLRSKWPTISDLDRSKAIVTILAAGATGRQLAAALGCSESLLRHLRLLAKATFEEKRQLRAGLISTREAIRRIEAQLALKARKAQKAEKRAQLSGAERGANRVINWFRDEQISHPYAEQILIETRRKLAEAEMTNTLPKEKAPAGLLVADIIRRSALVVPDFGDDFSFVERFARWLALWVCYAMPDIRVREGALDIALNRLSAR